MGFDLIRIELQPQAQVYFSGQQLQGYVNVRSSSEVSCRGITVSVVGKGEVQWTEHRNKRTYTYSNSERYTDQTLSLWSGHATNNKLEPGNHMFPFSMILEPRLPTSFETSTGSVKYYLKVSADIPWGIDVSEKLPFNVHNIYDLNLDPRANRPLSLEGEEMAGSCCCEVGPVTFDISVPRMGYVPGEVMYLNGTITNHSLSDVKYTEAKIIQRILYRATSKTKEEETTLQRVYRQSIRPGRSDRWNRVPLPIPAVTPSVLEYCDIMHITYMLKVLAKLGCCKNPSVSLEIIIGSVALQPSRHGGAEVERRLLAQSVGPAMPMPSAPMAQNEYVADDPPPYPDSEPPAYEDIHNKGAGPRSWGNNEKPF